MPYFSFEVLQVLSAPFSFLFLPDVPLSSAAPPSFFLSFSAMSAKFSTLVKTRPDVFSDLFDDWLLSAQKLLQCCCMLQCTHLWGWGMSFW